MVSAGKRVRQAPQRASEEFLVLRLKIQPVDLGQQTSRRVQLAIDECHIEDQLCPFVGDLCLPPGFDLVLHRFEVSPDPIHCDRKGVNQIEALTVLAMQRFCRQRYLCLGSRCEIFREGRTQRMLQQTPAAVRIWREDLRERR
jgi:hypothetical protein